MNSTGSIRYAGVNDCKIDLFEGQYRVPNGMSYNSYVIEDKQCAVLDTADAHYADEWLSNVERILNGRNADYLIVSHMEMDHAAGIVQFMEKNPQAKIVATAAAFRMMTQFFKTDFSERKIIAADGSTLDLGTHRLTFITAPMVHWPEVMMTYDAADKTLFSADAFGKFGALGTEEEWDCEARRYYFGIVGKYGQQVQSLLKKVSALDIQNICPLHGPVLSENLSHYMQLYSIWSSYQSETDGVFIAYASVYGNTKKAAQLLARKLEAANVKYEIADLAREDMAECVENAFRYSKLVLASVTYDSGVFPCMKTFISMIADRNFQNKTVAFIENGSWAPAAAKTMKQLLEGCRNISFAQNQVTVKSALSSGSEAAVESLAQELAG